MGDSISSIKDRLSYLTLDIGGGVKKGKYRFIISSVDVNAASKMTPRHCSLLAISTASAVPKDRPNNNTEDVLNPFSSMRYRKSTWASAWSDGFHMKAELQ